MSKLWVTGGLWLAGLVGVSVFGYSLTQQTAIQAQMNQTMLQIDAAIVTTGGLVDGTAKALQPLVATTKALKTIEQKEQATVSDLTSMNQHLADSAQTENGIVQGLDSLNQVAQGVNHDLSNMSQVNALLLESSISSAGQANLEAMKVGQLNGMTATSIAQLQQLNHKLSALRMLP